MDVPWEAGGFGRFDGFAAASDGEGPGAFFFGFSLGAALLGALVLGVGDGRSRSAPGDSPPPLDGVAKEMRPPGAELASVLGSAALAAGSLDSFSITVTAVTQAVIVARASAPASQSRKVPGARVVSGAQSLSQGRS
ncbi:hypothetical protein GCM10010384_50460 [Streptomyces djakartensis]|uniref:Uncharacterized protein n=1 Tax=Streptomyces djakartensis TaxID=68193 RepID=A0ABQ3A933_9ACTN|nr:hypothetical protein GCM10010384_50460 [Streptomyces djakartensis]